MTTMWFVFSFGSIPHSLCSSLSLSLYRFLSLLCGIISFIVVNLINVAYISLDTYCYISFSCHSLPLDIRVVCRVLCFSSMLSDAIESRKNQVQDYLPSHRHHNLLSERDDDFTTSHLHFSLSLSLSLSRHRPLPSFHSLSDALLVASRHPILSRSPSIQKYLLNPPAPDSSSS